MKRKFRSLVSFYWGTNSSTTMKLFLQVYPELAKDSVQQQQFYSAKCEM